MKDDLPEKTDLINRKSKAAFMDSNPNEPEETLCNSEKTSSDGDDEAEQDAAPNNSSVCRGLAISKVRYQAQVYYFVLLTSEMLNFFFFSPGIEEISVKSNGTRNDMHDGRIHHRS